MNATGTNGSPPPVGEPRSSLASSRPVLITGGAGFIGTNLAHRLLGVGRTVLLFDNLSRPGVEQNLEWLRREHGHRVRITVADIRDRLAVAEAVRSAVEVFHFAGQVAVTTSMENPLHDFEVNARGTLNVLEALRGLSHPPPLVFTSTNKVYGDLGDIALRKTPARYEPEDQRLRESGVDEHRSPDFHSPYGCSKGAADQYVLDYARTFGLRAVVFRMSCIYGPRQFGTEDQGWVAHFMLRALAGRPIVLYGDGLQVRDVLFVDDLIDAFLLAQRHIDAVGGQAFNIGGGPKNTTSLRELLDLIRILHADEVDVRVRDWRPGDQRYYVSDTRKFNRLTGWTPTVGVEAGVRRLYDWLREARELPAVGTKLPPRAAGDIAAPHATAASDTYRAAKDVA
jgi:CDP-paratose 2-epimerase